MQFVWQNMALKSNNNRTIVVKSFTQAGVFELISIEFGNDTPQINSPWLNDAIWLYRS